jgi:V/A-type H+-transporting ATPase subunit D
MKRFSATRSELLGRRARIGLATQGRDLLKERRNALVHEFHRLGPSALDSIDQLERDAADASRLAWPPHSSSATSTLRRTRPWPP